MATCFNYISKYFVGVLLFLVAFSAKTQAQAQEDIQNNYPILRCMVQTTQ